MDYKDKIYATDNESIGNDFIFNEQVAEVFNDMVNRSIPGYQDIIKGINLIANKFVTDNSNIYDLGCSLGSVTKSLRQELEKSTKQGLSFYAYDNSSSMVERAKLLINSYHSRFSVQIGMIDINQVQVNNSSLVVLNFVLQFIERKQRYSLLNKIYSGMQNNGVLILSEKIYYHKAEDNQLMIELHHDFKKKNGYSELEIQRKRDALEKVMLLDSLEIHLERLQEIGFKQVLLWKQQLNFCSIMAIK